MSNDSDKEQGKRLTVRLDDPMLRNQWNGFKDESLSMHRPVDMPLDLLLHINRALGLKTADSNTENQE